jgi:hypothetical protein
MKTRDWKIIVLLTPLLIFTAANVFAQDPAHEAAMFAIRSFFADPAARANCASENPAAFKAEQDLMALPPNIQKRIEKVALMILQEDGENASRHVDALNISGPEGAFNSFSPAVRKEIQDIAGELEKDPEFMKNAGYLK